MPTIDDDEPTVSRPVTLPSASPQPRFHAEPVSRQVPAKPPTRKPSRPLRPVAVSGENRLMQAAEPLFSLLCQIALSRRPEDPDALQRRMLAQFETFTQAARQADIDEATLTSARYVLASTLDEAVLGTSWGFESSWGSRSLLTVLFRETWGGEKVFVLLDELMASPAENIDLLEVIDRCLTLGFQGRYRTLEGGPVAIEELRQRLDQICVGLRPRRTLEFSPAIQVSDRGRRLFRYPPDWLCAVLALGVLVAGFYNYAGRLEDLTTPVVERLAQLAGTLSH